MFIFGLTLFDMCGGVLYLFFCSHYVTAFVCYVFSFL